MIAIAAMTPSRVIGRDGTIPWHLTEDLRFFKRTTLGHIVLMGRKTFDSIGKPLPGRENWVLTRGPVIEGTRCFASPAEIVVPEDGRQIFVIGGAAVYEIFLPRCRELFLTLLHQEYSGDTLFPLWEDAFTSTEVLLKTPEFTIHRFTRTRLGS